MSPCLKLNFGWGGSFVLMAGSPGVLLFPATWTNSFLSLSSAGVIDVSHQAQLSFVNPWVFLAGVFRFKELNVSAVLERLFSDQSSPLCCSFPTLVSSFKNPTLLILSKLNGLIMGDLFSLGLGPWHLRSMGLRPFSLWGYAGRSVPSFLPHQFHMPLPPCAYYTLCQISLVHDGLILTMM